jgi:RecA-family ATPase
VPPFFPEGLIILAGSPGLGKSYFALNMALAVATGGKAFGTLDTTKGEVLYLSFEDDEQGMQERLDTVWEDDGEPWPDTLHIQHEDVPKLGAGLVESLGYWLDEHHDARLIIIDVFGDVKPPRRANSDWYLDDKALLTPLLRLAHMRHVAIVLLHHTNRRENPDNPFESILGGGAIEGTPDTKAMLMRGMGKSDAVLAIHGRSVAEQRAAFAYQAGVWTYQGQAEDFERTDERQAILTFLRATPDAVTPKHVAALLGREESATRKLMRTMARQGEIKKTGYGRYTAHPLVRLSLPDSQNCRLCKFRGGNWLRCFQ